MSIPISCLGFFISTLPRSYTSTRWSYGSSWDLLGTIYRFLPEERSGAQTVRVAARNAPISASEMRTARPRRWTGSAPEFMSRRTVRVEGGVEFLHDLCRGPRRQLPQTVGAQHTGLDRLLVRRSVPSVRAPPSARISAAICCRSKLCQRADQRNDLTITRLRLAQRYVRLIEPKCSPEIMQTKCREGYWHRVCARWPLASSRASRASPGRVCASPETIRSAACARWSKR